MGLLRNSKEANVREQSEKRRVVRGEIREVLRSKTVN